MARQNLNFFEQHVEKFVVAAVALLFLGIVYAYVLKSPNKVSLGSEMVGPGEVDNRVKAAAEQVLSRMRGAQAEVGEVRDYPGQLRRRSVGPLQREDQPLEPTLRRAVTFGVPVPEVEGPQAPGQVRVATLVPPGKPVVETGRVSALFPPRSVPIGEELPAWERQLMDFDGPQDKSWVTIAARFDLLKQERVFAEHNYQTTRYGVVSSDVMVQRQKRMPDGEWGPWEDVQDFAEYHMDPPPELTLVSDAEQGLTVPPQQREALKIWYENLVEFERDLVRPPMPEADFGDPWRPPLLAELVKLYPEEGFDLIEPKTVETVGRTRKLPPRKQAQLDLEESRRLLEQGRMDEALILLDDIIQNSRISPRNSVKRQAIELERQIREQQETLERRLIAERAGEAGDEAEDEDVEVRRNEEIYFAHDVTAESGAEYRYRLKIQAFNQYATIAQRLKNPERDATRVYVESEWSPPSDPVRVPPIQRLYLASAKIEDDDEEARFDVYQWYQGQWVKAQFSAEVGEPIGGPKKVVHRQGRIDVTFDTGAVLIDLDPDKTFVPVKKRRDGTSELGEPEKTTAAVCQKKDGEVFELVLLAAKTDEERRAIEKEIDDVMRARRRDRAPSGSTTSGRSSRGRGG